MTWNINDGGKVTLDTLAQRRQWQLDHLEKNTELLAQYVRDEYAQGEEISRLAKRANVSRPTIYRWIGIGAEPSSS